MYAIATLDESTCMPEDMVSCYSAAVLLARSEVQRVHNCTHLFTLVAITQ
jgi:hypothetical protein